MFKYIVECDECGRRADIDGGEFLTKRDAGRILRPLDWLVQILHEQIVCDTCLLVDHELMAMARGDDETVALNAIRSLDKRGICAECGGSTETHDC